MIYGRSDSTINRGGVRMGTTEIYRAVLAVDEVVDALVVDVPREGGGELDAAVRRAARGRRARRRAGGARSASASARTARRATCRTRSSPIDEVPRTLSGKVLEVPVKRILIGHRPGEGGEPRLARQPRGARLVRRAR